MKDIRERFYSKVKIVEGDGCWEWQGCLNYGGYGLFSCKKKIHKAHRIAWTLHNGPIPDGMFVCHVCDNRKCVRPDHLFLGSPRDNVVDMLQKGRDNKLSKSENMKKRHKSGEIKSLLAFNRGSTHYLSKFTEDQAILCKAFPPHALALFIQEFNVHRKTVYNIRSGKSWKHLPEPTEEHIQKAKELFETLKNK